MQCVGVSRVAGVVTRSPHVVKRLLPLCHYTSNMDSLTRSSTFLYIFCMFLKWGRDSHTYLVNKSNHGIFCSVKAAYLSCTIMQYQWVGELPFTPGTAYSPQYH